MGALKSNQETEIKLRAGSAASARRRLRQAGFHVVHRRSLEQNTLYDTESSALRRSGQLLRLRRYGRQQVLTYKGPATVGQHRRREEIELSLSDVTVAGAILEKLGYRPTFRYEKYRTEYRCDGQPGLVTLDETPAGVFLELEGPPGWIDRTAKRLGYSPPDYVTGSYAAVWMAFCAEHGLGERDMLFGETTSFPLTQSKKLT
jgi:adenylate cyclase class 2